MVCQSTDASTQLDAGGHSVVGLFLERNGKRRRAWVWWRRMQTRSLGFKEPRKVLALVRAGVTTEARVIRTISPAKSIVLEIQEPRFLET